MTSSIETYGSYSTSHLYLFPLVPDRPVPLYRVILGARLASAGTATLRLALYRIENLNLSLHRPRTILGTALSYVFVDELAVRYAEFEASAYTDRTAITNTSGWFRVLGTLEPTVRIDPDIGYALAIAPSVATVQLAAPTALIDQPGVEATNQNPGTAAFPRNPTANLTARTPAFTLLSKAGAAAYGG